MRWLITSLARVVVWGLPLLAGCAAHHAGAAPAPLNVVRAVSAHHGDCSRASRRVLGARAAQLFAAPLPYVPYKCVAETESDILRSVRCAKSHRNLVFLTLDRARPVVFVQGPSSITVPIRTFAVSWNYDINHASLFFATEDFPMAQHPYRGPPLYAEFDVKADPFDMATSECPAMVSPRA